MTQVDELKDPPVRNYLGSLNEAQREAVEFGVVHRAGESLSGPLLVIAGAGSGKTNTLAHRVAHLIANGADPGKILLLTFSRRAAVEMTRRVERIIGHLMKVNRGAVTGSLAWSGTFHSVGARLLREYAGRIGLWSERASSSRPRLVSIRDDAEQAGFVVEQILARREEGVKLKSQAILFRAGHHSARLEIELIRRNIPYVKFGGLKFLEAAHVKDVLAVMRWAQNPRDRVSGFRAIQLLPGIGPKTAARILDNVATANPGCELLAEQPVPEPARIAWTSWCPRSFTRASNRAWGIATCMPAVPVSYRTRCCPTTTICHGRLRKRMSRQARRQAEGQWTWRHKCVRCGPDVVGRAELSGPSFIPISGPGGRCTHGEAGMAWRAARARATSPAPYLLPSRSTRSIADCSFSIMVHET